MPNGLLTAAVRAKFAFMSKDRASLQIERILKGYRRLGATVDAVSGSRPILVPRMPGVDEDMRNWSFFMLLEHNVIVNRSMTSIVGSLIRGETPQGPGAIDPKRDVMPSPNPGPEQIDALAASVSDHLQLVSPHRHLRGKSTKRHPIFGRFNAHQWHCMVGFHLRIHYRQAKTIATLASAQ